jgi:hypothetical protein
VELKPIPACRISAAMVQLFQLQSSLAVILILLIGFHRGRPPCEFPIASTARMMPADQLCQAKPLTSGMAALVPGAARWAKLLTLSADLLDLLSQFRIEVALVGDLIVGWDIQPLVFDDADGFPGGLLL